MTGRSAGGLIGEEAEHHAARAGHGCGLCAVQDKCLLDLIDALTLLALKCLLKDVAHVRAQRVRIAALDGVKHRIGVGTFADRHAVHAREERGRGDGKVRLADGDKELRRGLQLRQPFAAALGKLSASADAEGDVAADARADRFEPFVRERRGDERAQRTQHRGGVGAKGSATRDEDFIEHIYVASMHNTMLFFTEKGRCYWLKVYDIPEGARSSKGRAIQNVIQIEPDDKVRAYINVKRLNDEEYVNNNYIIMCTKDGTIKKTRLEAYSRPRQNGVNAIVIREGDQLIEAKLTSGQAEVMIAAREGKAIRFNENTVRPIGRVGAGVRGISLDEGDEVVGMICVEPDSKQDVLVLSENGYGKRTDLDEYRITNRGGKGVKTINITEKTGKLIAIQAVTDENDLMIINRSGLTIRTSVSQIRLAGRATQGVRIINLREGDAIASVMAVPAAGEEETSAAEETPTAESASGNETEQGTTPAPEQPAQE